MPPSIEAFLDEPVESLGSARLSRWAARQGIGIMRELVAVCPYRLSRANTLGTTVARHLGSVIEGRTGLCWEELRNAILDVGVPGSVAVAEGWDDLSDLLDERMKHLPLTALTLPRRIARFCEREGLQSLGALTAWREADLLAVPNVGMVTLRRTRLLIAAFSRVQPREGHLPFPPDTSLLELLHRALATMQPTDRLVFEQRSGLRGSPRTLTAIGADLNVSRQRVRQRELRAIAHLAGMWWATPARAWLSSLLDEGSRPLAEFAASGFWSHVAQHPVLFDYLLRRLFDEVGIVATQSGDPIDRPQSRRASSGRANEARTERLSYLVCASKSPPHARRPRRRKAANASESSGPAFDGDASLANRDGSSRAS